MINRHSTGKNPVRSLTLLPLDTDHEGNSPIDGIIREDTTRRAVSTGQSDLRVDVKRKSSAARRENSGCEWDGILKLVVARCGALEVG